MFSFIRKQCCSASRLRLKRAITKPRTISNIICKCHKQDLRNLSKVNKTYILVLESFIQIIIYKYYVLGDPRRFEVWLQGRAEVHTLTALTATARQAWVAQIKRVLLDQLEELKGERVKQYYHHQPVSVHLTNHQPRYVTSHNQYRVWILIQFYLKVSKTSRLLGFGRRYWSQRSHSFQNYEL